MKKMKRILAIMLCLTMAISGPLSVFAEETDVIIEETITEEEEKTSMCETCQQESCTCEPAAEEPEVEEELEGAEEQEVCENCAQDPCICVPAEDDKEPQDVSDEEVIETEEDETGAQEGCSECGNIEGHAETCSQYEDTVLTVAEQLLEAESVEEMYILVLDLMQNDPEALMALSTDEIAYLRERINELDPEGDDVDTQDLLDTLAVLPDGGEVLDGDPVNLASTTFNADKNWQGDVTLSDDTTYTFNNGAVLTLNKGPITVPDGITLTIKGWGSVARTANNTKELFIVQAGGKLVIEGSSKDQSITIDGKDVIADKSLITSSGTLELKYAVIQNGKNRIVNNYGGGITIGAGGKMNMDYCTVTHNTVTEYGGGIYCVNGEMTISNSVISYNVAATGSNVLTNEGRGGGFDIVGENAVCTLRNTIIEYNDALYYGGGGQARSNATVNMEEGTIFRHNRAILHGAGALHLTADAKFYMNGGSMVNNYARYCGGAIHSSYSCVLQLNKGQINNNTTDGRGGGVHVNTGGAITLNENITISGNKAYDKPIGTYAEVTDTGEIIESTVKYEGHHEDFGYGGGVLIDSGTCTVAGATITDNYAQTGGGGIALTMLNMGEGGLDDLMVIKFTMTAGTVANNGTAGNGAGVYIMTNKAEENLGKAFHNDSALTLEQAKEKIDETNKHGFSAENIISGIPEAIVSGGTISNNAAAINGGGLYLGENTKFIINGGSISANKAVDGAGVYVASGTAEINGGTMTANAASSDGGALYIEGNVTMTNGSIGGDTEAKANTAVNGGAMYVSNGNVTIEHGTISGNKAIGSGDDLQDTTNNTGRGGAVYLAGDTNTMLTMESGTMNKNQASNDGGAIFATGGTILIGLKSCSTETAGAKCEHHTDDRHHPVINENKAGDTGGGIALTDGVVRFYCGRAKDNQALYKGVGKNVFMDGGQFHLYDGADIGVPRDPDLVIVGGELHNECVYKEYVYLYYYENNTKTTTDMIGLAEYEEIMNLPDGEYFWNAPEGYVFLGWTAQGAASGNQSNGYVRNKEQYVNSGEPVEILDRLSTETDQTAINTNKVFDGTTDTGGKGKIMHLYALWAPKTSNITYVNGLTGDEIANTETDPDNPATYTFNRESNVINIQPVKQPGYDLLGWYIYQDEYQNANWNDTQADYDNKKYEPNYTGTDYSNQKVYHKLDSRNGVLELEAGYTNFGNITLIADYEQAYTNLKITKSGANETLDPDQTFIFKITGDAYIDGTDQLDDTLPDIKMEVAIKGNKTITIEHLPVGTYTIEELSGWSWRYESIVEQDGVINVQNIKTVILNDSTVEFSVEFTNRRKESKWLDGSSHAQNIFGTDKIISSGNIYQEGGN